MINVLIRLHKNIDKFLNTLETVYNQTYQNINILVSVDDYDTYKYVCLNHAKKCRFIYIDPKDLYPGPKTYEKNTYGTLFIPNIYFNILHQYVRCGYIFYLDVGDTILDNNMFSKIESYMADKYTVVWKIIGKRGKIITGKWRDKPILCDIDSSSFMFHSDYIENWTGYTKGDFRVINKIYQKNKTIFIPEVYIKKDIGV